MVLPGCSTAIVVVVVFAAAAGATIQPGPPKSDFIFSWLAKISSSSSRETKEWLCSASMLNGQAAS